MHQIYYTLLILLIVLQTSHAATQAQLSITTHHDTLTIYNPTPLKQSITIVTGQHITTLSIPAHANHTIPVHNTTHILHDGKQIHTHTPHTQHNNPTQTSSNTQTPLNQKESKQPSPTTQTSYLSSTQRNFTTGTCIAIAAFALLAILFKKEQYVNTKSN